MRTRRGFTLLEMLVSLGIFMVVAVIAVGALVRMTDANRRAQSLQSSANNLGSALESMSREMRFGSSFYCQDYADPTSASGISGSGIINVGPSGGFCGIDDHSQQTKSRMIAFLSQYTDLGNSSCRLIYAYMFVPQIVNGVRTWRLMKAQQSSCTGAGSQLSYPASFNPVLDETNVTITDNRFGVFPPSYNGCGAQCSLHKYSLVFIRLTGYTGIRVQDQSLFDVQTAISLRLADK